MREVSLPDRVRRTHILTPAEQAAVDAIRVKQQRLTRIRRVYATVWWSLVLPVAAAAGWFADQTSLWLLVLMAVSIVVLKPVTALAVLDRRPREGDEDDYDGPAVDIAEVDAVHTGGSAYVGLAAEPFDVYAAEEREGQP